MKEKFDIKEFGIVPPPYGGCSTYVKRLIDKLTSDGYLVGGFYTDLCEEERIRCSPLYDCWNWMETYLLPFKIWKYLEIVKPYSIIHSHFSLEGMSYLWLLKKIGGKKIIVTIHNSMVSSFYKRTNIVNRFFLKKMLRSKDVCWITVSDDARKQLLSLPTIPVSDIHVFPAYIPVTDDFYKPLKTKILSYIKRHAKNIAFYGHCFMINDGVDVYGFRTIIDVYSKLVNSSSYNVGLILCLSDNHETKKIEELHCYARGRDVDDCIFWQIGPIDNIRTLWQSVDVYVRPTSTDGDSVSIREVLDEGTLVIASDVCSRPKGVVNYKFGDDEDLYSKLVLCLGKTRTNVTQNFEYYFRMKEIYDSLLNK